MQCIFLLYCMAPAAWNGSALIYNKFLRPFVLKYEKDIDEALDRTANLARDAMGEGGYRVLFIIYIVSLY